MLRVDEALELVMAEARPLPARRVALAEAWGRVLAEEITSDVDSPPHDKAVVDGYAVAAPLDAPAVLRVVEEITAGQIPTQAVAAGTAARIMTGAPLPSGASAVVMVERTERIGDGQVRIVQSAQPGQNIVRRGQSMRRGDVVLRAGALLRPMEIGLLAEVGCAEVLVRPAPRVAVLATGNELVPAGGLPAAGQIRNSNGPMLVALAQAAGAEPVDLGVARDEPADLKAKIAAGLAADVLALSGGVSAGVLDLVPAMLAEAGVQEVFHKVSLKPGKPLWFGVRQAERCTLVFGLPGNPVSSLVCFELFVRPTLRRLAGRKDLLRPILQATLTGEHLQRSDRDTYWPSRLEERPDGTRLLAPLAWQGSGDLRTLVEANALAIFPAGDRHYAVGDTVAALPLDEPGMASFSGQETSTGGPARATFPRPA
jgi:molybdopterin molybdotransferase